MKRIVLGILIGMALAAPSVLAFRMAKPPTFIEWNTNTFSQLNDVLSNLWSITNGRYQADSISTNPNATRNCTKGEVIGANFSGADHICQCTTSGNTWKCVVIS